MPIQVNKPKWILYKHTNNYDLIKAVAMDVKNQCNSVVNGNERMKMQRRLELLGLYHARNTQDKPLDAINHRINTLEYFMFGYENREHNFIFSPLGNLFLDYIDDEEKLKKIFVTMLFAIQFQHYASRTPRQFQLYPFRLLLKLMCDERLNCRLYSTEYAYIIAFVDTINLEKYDELVNTVLEFRNLTDDEKYCLLKQEEHVSVNTIYEWQYYTQTLLKHAGIIDVHDGESIGILYHPQKTNSHSNPTSRIVRNGYAQISEALQDYIKSMLEKYSVFDKPLIFNDPERLKMDIVKDVYSFYPKELLNEIGVEDSDHISRLMQLPKLIEEYSNNPNNETADLFEDVLNQGFNLFSNVESRRIGGPGNTDLECLYFTRHIKFAVDAKSTQNKLLNLSAGRLGHHRELIGGEYTVVVTSRYVPSVLYDIEGQPIVIILASTFSEYLYNHIYHGVRDMDYGDFDSIIVRHLGMDISEHISRITMGRFGTRNTNVSSRNRPYMLEDSECLGIYESDRAAEGGSGDGYSRGSYVRQNDEG